MPRVKNFGYLEINPDEGGIFYNKEDQGTLVNLQLRCAVRADSSNRSAREEYVSWVAGDPECSHACFWEEKNGIIVRVEELIAFPRVIVEMFRRFLERKVPDGTTLEISAITDGIERTYYLGYFLPGERVKNPCNYVRSLASAFGKCVKEARAL